MQHIIFSNNVATKYKVAFLIKESALKEKDIRKYYINKVVTPILKEDSFIAYSLAYNEFNKAPVKLIKQHLGNVLKACKHQEVQTIYIADGNYFKTLTKNRKAEPFIGIIQECKIEGFENIQVIYTPNYQTLKYSPDNQKKLDIANQTLKEHLTGLSLSLGSDVIHKAVYPKTSIEIENVLNKLLKYPSLSCDIEGFGLALNECGIGTIAFAIDQHKGVAFSMYTPNAEGFINPNCEKAFNWDILLEFFRNYKGKLIFHNASFDIKHLIFSLLMHRCLGNYKQALEGLELFYDKGIHDTKIITYLATNNCQENKLSLKDTAFPYLGNYAEDVKDITIIPIKDLLEYNLKDCLGTWYTHDTNYPIMVKSNQEKLYCSLMLPALKNITNMELVGLPIDMEEVLKAEKELTEILEINIKLLNENTLVNRFVWLKTLNTLKVVNSKLKTKIKNWDECVEDFNPNSDTQVRILLYEFLGLPVIDLTDKKQPATGSKTIKKILNHVENSNNRNKQSIISVLNCLIKVSEVSILLSTFITAFKSKSIQDSTGQYFLLGNLNLGGTVSGRLSSSKPNLMNIPSSGSTYSKLIKRCFKMLSDKWLFGGADFSSLEDRISALTTKDPAKLSVYEGHTIYEVDLDGVVHHIRDDSTVNYNGKQYTGEAFYELF